MVDGGYEFFTLKKVSLHLLNLGAPPVRARERREKSTELSKLTQLMKTAIGWLKQD